MNRTLKEVNLCGNKIGDNGITAIARALENSNISQLNVRECGITYVGAKALSEALLINHSIRELWVMGNPITVEGARCIVQSAVQNTACQEILIDDDYENDDEVKKMMTFIDDKKIERFVNMCCLSL